MRPGKKTRQRGGDNSYWTSYSDMMAGMLFVFALILFALLGPEELRRLVDSPREAARYFYII